MATKKYKSPKGKSNKAEEPLVAYRAIAKPFLKWAGGKTQLLPEIEKALPKEIYTWKSFTYIEPFAGSGAVLFWMLHKFPQMKRVVINDINTDLTIAYSVIKNNHELLIKKLSELQLKYRLIETEDQRREFFLQQREKFNTKELSEVENTTLLIFLNRTCFNGLYRVNASGLFNVPFGKYSNPKICDAENIRLVSEALQKVEILNTDFQQTIEKAQGNTLFYFDPPYKPLTGTSSFNAYAKENFGDAEQERLKTFCDQLNAKKFYWILSNSDMKSNDPDNYYFDNLYQEYHIKRVLASRLINANADKRGVLNELIITNYE